MKLLFFLVGLFSAYVINAQSYIPFKADSPKKFVSTTDPSDSLKFFFAIEEEINNDTVTIKQYYGLSDEMVDVSNDQYCAGWGGGIQPTCDTNWLGRKIDFISTTQTLLTYNGDGDTLQFDFALNVGDSSLIYSATNNNYFLKHTSTGNTVILDSLQNVKYFEILHYDDVDQVVSSALHQFQIVLTENNGLSSFIDCYHFPDIEKGFNLTGQQNPNLGYYQLTYDEVYPWNVGDTIQLYGQVSGTWHYRMITISNRTETSDSCWIDLEFEDTTNYNAQFPMPSPYFINYPQTLIFNKHESIIKEPRGMRANYGSTQIIGTTDQCGEELMRSYGEFLMYCDSCDCVVPFDGFGSTVYASDYSAKRGKTHQSAWSYGMSPFTATANVIYSNVGGEICGDYYAVGLNEQELTFSLFPNPTNTSISVHSSNFPLTVNLHNLNGALLVSQTLQNDLDTIDVSLFKSGLYILVVRSGSNLAIRKLVIE
jgi:hypothetical protein